MAEEANKLTELKQRLQAQRDARKRPRYPLDGEALAKTYFAVAPRNTGDRWKTEQCLHFTEENIRGIRRLEDFEAILGRAIRHFDDLVPDHPDVINSRKILEALIPTANEQLPSEYHFTWEALSQFKYEWEKQRER